MPTKVTRAADLTLPLSAIEVDFQSVLLQLAEQVDDTREIQRVVAHLERQYDGEINRARVLHVAVDLLATRGIRDLTHRQVDRHAGLLEGTTSNSFRTRTALLYCVRLFEQMVGPLRPTTTPRLALLVEATHDRDRQVPPRQRASQLHRPPRIGLRTPRGL